METSDQLTMAPRGAISPVEIAKFREDGFLIFDPKLPKAEIDLIRSTLMGLHENGTGFSEGAQFDAISATDTGGPKRFPQILHPRVFAPMLLETEFYRTAHAAAQRILGDDVRFKADISLLKPAKIGAATPWHQDEAFLNPDYDYDEVSFWLALQPTDETNSCMAFVPGSQKGPVLPHGFVGDDPRVHALECKSGFDPAQGVFCVLPAGGCTLHSHRTLHYAGPNTSDGARLAYVLLFNANPKPVTTPRSFPWLAKQKTARAERELTWRRRGGLLVHLWRQRHRIRAKTILFDIHRVARASWQLMRK